VLRFSTYSSHPTRTPSQSQKCTTDKRVCGVFHPVWCFLWCFSPEVKSPQILVVICVAISPQVQITTSICGDLFEFQSKLGGHYENIKNIFDSMCTLYLECFLQGIEEHFWAKKMQTKNFLQVRITTSHNLELTSTVHDRHVPVKSPRIPYSPHI